MASVPAVLYSKSKYNLSQLKLGQTQPSQVLCRHPKEYVLVIERTAPAASSKDVTHTTSPPEVESSVEIGTNSPVPVRFLFWCNLQSYIFFGSKALWDKKKKNMRAHLCLLGPSKEYILVD